MADYKWSTNVGKEEYENFVSNHKMANLLQSYDWAKIKSNWDKVYTGVYENGNLKAAGLVLIRSLPLGFKLFYIPRGPVMDYKDEKLVNFYMNEIQKYAKSKRALYITFDPALHYKDYHLDEDGKVNEDFKQAFNNIKNTGAIHAGFTKDFSSTIQPRYNMAVLKNEFSLDNLSKKGKKNLKIAQKKNIDVVFGHEELLDDFNSVMECTEARKQIGLRNKDYYSHLLNTYKDNAFIALGYLDLEKTYSEVKERLEKCRADLESCPENAKKKRFTLEEQLVSLERQEKDLKEDMEKYGKKTVISGTLSVVYGKTSEILYAGMNDHFKRYMAPYLVWYLTMEECFKRGCDWSNMGGIEGDLSGGLVDFKSVYHPVIFEYVGEFDLPVNKMLYSLSKKAYQYMKNKKAAD